MTPQLEPLLLELRDRVLQATGEEPREVLANWRFGIDMYTQKQWFLSYSLCAKHQFRYNKMTVRYILPTDITTLVVRV